MMDEMEVEEAKERRREGGKRGGKKKRGREEGKGRRSRVGRTGKAFMDALREQIEFYFCDLNLIQDKFLRGVVETQGGWVPVDTLIGFNNVKKLAGTKDDIVKALKGSVDLEVRDDGEAVRRRKPLPSEDEIDSRAVFVGGLGKDMTRDDVVKFVSGIADVECVRMNYARHGEALDFSGTAFVEFRSVEERDKFVSAAPTLNGVALSIKPRSEKTQRRGKKGKSVFCKLTVSERVNNRDFKSVLKNSELFKGSVTKYYVERVAVTWRKDEKMSGAKKVSENEKKESVEEKKDVIEEKKDAVVEKKDAIERKNEGDEEKKDGNKEEKKGTKTVFVAIKSSGDVDAVKKALGELRFYNAGVTVEDCTADDEERFRSFSVPVASGKGKRSKHERNGN